MHRGPFQEIRLAAEQRNQLIEKSLSEQSGNAKGEKNPFDAMEVWAFEEYQKQAVADEDRLALSGTTAP